MKHINFGQRNNENFPFCYLTFELLTFVRFTPQKPSLFGAALESLKGQIEAAGHKGFRANQNWIGSTKARRFLGMP